MAIRDERIPDGPDAGVGPSGCGAYLAALDSLHRSEILKDAAFDRLRRKLKAVERLFEEAGRNWNQTFYLMFFRTLGDKRNQEAYLDLARRATYAMVLRERASLHNVEALLLGASGLLGLYRHDAYTLDLGRDFVYLAAKYGIEPKDASAWDFARIHPANHPVLRVAQAAAFFAGHDFVMERMLDCRTPDDAARLFGTAASEYWHTHHLPAIRSQEVPKRIGIFKANLMAINLVSVMQFAYGSHTGNDLLRDRAITLLERTPAEENVYMRRWQAAGLSPRNAFESQALLQIATEYCPARRCAACPVGVRRIKSRTED